MAGHSKWANIKHRKSAQDKRKGNIFTKHAKLIAVAAREGGGDVSANPTLKLYIDKARFDNMPNDNIERAIRRGTGADKDAATIEHITYEGYGPGASAIIVKCLTDNKNRAVSNVRHIFSKYGGNLGVGGSVSFMFDYRGVFQVDPAGQDIDTAEMKLLDLGVGDIEEDEGKLTCFVDPSSLMQTVKSIGAAGLKVTDPMRAYIPKDLVDPDADARAKLDTLVGMLEEDDDVEEVFTNVQ